jgi:hypothetical protein
LLLDSSDKVYLLPPPTNFIHIRSKIALYIKVYVLLYAHLVKYLSGQKVLRINLKVTIKRVFILNEFSNQSYNFTNQELKLKQLKDIITLSH